MSVILIFSTYLNNAAYAFLSVENWDIESKEQFEDFDKRKDSLDEISLYQYASMLYLGKATIKDNKKAFKYFLKSAELGYIRSKVQVAIMMNNGDGCPRNNVMSVSFFEDAAQKGDAYSQYSLSLIYGDPEFEHYNLEKSEKWHQQAIKNRMNEKAFIGCIDFCNIVLDLRSLFLIHKARAKNNDVNSYAILGNLYLRGEGTEKNYNEALKWLTLAVHEKNKYAMNTLGTMYEDGKGLPQSYKYAYMWYIIASIDGSNNEATNNRDKILSKLSQNHILQAQEYANKCIDQNYKNCSF